MALAVASFGLTMLFVTQGKLLEQVARMVQRWDVAVELSTMLIEASETAESSRNNIEKEARGATLQCTVKKIGENSSLKKIKNLRLVQADARWQVLGFEQRSTLMSALVEPEERANAKE